MKGSYNKKKDRGYSEKSQNENNFYNGLREEDLAGVDGT